MLVASHSERPFSFRLKIGTRRVCKYEHSTCWSSRVKLTCSHWMWAELWNCPNQQDAAEATLNDFWSLDTKALWPPPGSRSGCVCMKLALRTQPLLDCYTVRKAWRHTSSCVGVLVSSPSQAPSGLTASTNRRWTSLQNANATLETWAVESSCWGLR